LTSQKPSSPGQTDSSGFTSANAAGFATHIREDSDRLFFIFTGQARRLMTDSLVFLQSTGLLHHNLVIFRDPNGQHYFKGISDSVNSIGPLIELERSLLRRFAHVRRTFCLGTSMGAYAAILHGYYLSVEAVWAFGPQIQVRNLSKLTELEMRDEHADLQRLLTQSNGHTQYNIYYNENYLRDKKAAKSLDGLDGVLLKPQSGDDHNVIKTLQENELLDSIFKDI